VGDDDHGATLLGKLPHDTKDFTDQAPVDYKFLVFQGRVEVIQVHRDRFTAPKMTFYNRAWRKLAVLIVTDGVCEVVEDVARPARLDEMITAAEALARGIDFMRVDLYATPDRIYFSELTITPPTAWPATSRPSSTFSPGGLWNVERTREQLPP
jgi:hypothetical protein